MNEDLIFNPSDKLKKSTHISKADYESLYLKSISDPENFWAEQGKRIDWIKPYKIVSNCSFNKNNISYPYFYLNLYVNDM